MPKSDMSDDQIKQLLTQIRDWMSKSDAEAAEQVAMKQGGKIKKHAKKPKAQRKLKKARDYFGNGGYSGGTSSGTGGGGNAVSRAITNVASRFSGSQAPSQQSGFMGKVDNAMGRMGFSAYTPHGHAGENASRDGAKGLARARQVAAPQANIPSLRLPDLPAYQNYQQMPQMHSQAPVMPSQAIANFNASQGLGVAAPQPMTQPALARGGRTDSVSSALRMIKNKLL